MTNKWRPTVSQLFRAAFQILIDNWSLRGASREQVRYTSGDRVVDGAFYYPETSAASSGVLLLPTASGLAPHEHALAMRLGSSWLFDPGDWLNEELLRHRSPLLILQGAKDDETVVANAKTADEFLRSAQKPCELVIYPEAGHQFDLFAPSSSASVDAWQRTIAFLDSHIGKASLTGAE